MTRVNMSFYSDNGVARAAALIVILEHALARNCVRGRHPSAFTNNSQTLGPVKTRLELLAIFPEDAQGKGAGWGCEVGCFCWQGVAEEGTVAFGG